MRKGEGYVHSGVNGSMWVVEDWRQQKWNRYGEGCTDQKEKRFKKQGGNHKVKAEEVHFHGSSLSHFCKFLVNTDKAPIYLQSHILKAWAELFVILLFD